MKLTSVHPSAISLTGDEPVSRPSGASVVVVDDQEANRELFRRLLSAHGYTVSMAPDGAAGLALVRRQMPDLVLSDCMMPVMSGYDLCRVLKHDLVTRFIPVVLVTGTEDEDARLLGIEAGADDFLRKPVNTQELTARVRSLVRLKRFTDELDSAESLILSLARTVEARDPYTAGHCERMAHYAAVFGTHLGLSVEAILALRRGGYLHDIGKIGLPDAILRKVGPLTSEEFEIMKRHTIIGDELCEDLRLLRLVRPIVRQHHERLDGSGYPDGARGDEISLLAQIVAIADVYDALTTDRPYRKAMSIQEAYSHLLVEGQSGWRHPDLVAEFIRLGEAGALLLPATSALPASTVAQRASRLAVS